jgi:hypothetical protein
VLQVELILLLGRDLGVNMSAMVVLDAVDHWVAFILNQVIETMVKHLIKLFTFMVVSMLLSGFSRAHQK